MAQSGYLRKESGVAEWGDRNLATHSIWGQEGDLLANISLLTKIKQKIPFCNS